MGQRAVLFLLQSCWCRHESGLLLSLLEPVEEAYCNQTVEEGDTLYVDYEVGDDYDADDDDGVDTIYADYAIPAWVRLDVHIKLCVPTLPPSPPPAREAWRTGLSSIPRRPGRRHSDPSSTARDRSSR